MEKLSLDFSVLFIKINVSTKPELVQRNKLVLNCLFLLQNVCLSYEESFFLCVETRTSKVKNNVAEKNVVFSKIVLYTFLPPRNFLC